MGTENKDIQKSKEQQDKERKERRKKIITTIAFVVLIIIIIILLLRSCGNSDYNPDNPLPDETQGEWNIGDKRPDETQDSSIVPESITFSGSDKYTVSPNRKEIELTNPEINQVNFVFTITDTQTGEVIAKTGKVAPSQYVYINIYDYFKEAGSYDVTIDISTFSFGGQQLNGASTKAVVTVTSD